MDVNTYKKLFREKANSVGFSEEEILHCLNYAIPIIENGYPVIYNTSHFASLVGYKKQYIKRAALYTESYYREFKIKKKNGTDRYLCEPLPSLKDIQIWVLKNILYKFQLNRFAKAYVPGRKILDNVRYHKDKDLVVGLDIENFFSSIKRYSVERIFLSFGYSSNISNLLSKICCLNDTLPQGAPTSAFLSNIFLNEFDYKVSDFCRPLKIRYTRYADDLTFSGNISLQELINFVHTELEGLDLKLNYEKMKVMTPNQRQVVTGVVVNKKVQLSSEYRKKIRQEVYYIKKIGLKAHMNNMNISNSNYLLHLIGKINHVLHINPKDNHMKEYKKFLYGIIDK